MFYVPYMAGSVVRNMLRGAIHCPLQYQVQNIVKCGIFSDRTQCDGLEGVAGGQRLLIGGPAILWEES